MDKQVLFLLDDDKVVEGVDALKGLVPKAYLFCSSKGERWWLYLTTYACDTYAEAQSTAQKVTLDGRPAQLLPVNVVNDFIHHHIDAFNAIKEHVNAISMKVDYPVTFADRYWAEGRHRPIMGNLANGGAVCVPEAEACILLGVPYEE